MGQVSKVNNKSKWVVQWCETILLEYWSTACDCFNTVFYNDVKLFYWNIDQLPATGSIQYFIWHCSTAWITWCFFHYTFRMTSHPYRKFQVQFNLATHSLDDCWLSVDTCLLSGFYINSKQRVKIWIIFAFFGCHLLCTSHVIVEHLKMCVYWLAGNRHLCQVFWLTGDTRATGRVRTGIQVGYSRLWSCLQWR